MKSVHNSLENLEFYKLGLESFLGVNSRAKVYLPDTGRASLPYQGEFIREAQEIAPDIYTTGVLKNIEQSLVVKSKKTQAYILKSIAPYLTRLAYS